MSLIAKFVGGWLLTIIAGTVVAAIVDTFTDSFALSCVAAGLTGFIGGIATRRDMNNG